MNIQATKARGGFTLLEVILAISIFVLLAGAIYFVVASSVRVGEMVGDHQITSREIDACERFLRDGFRNLPAAAQFEVGTRDLGQLGTAIDLVIWRAAGGFSIGNVDASGSSVVLSAVPDGRGKARLSLTRFAEKRPESELQAHLARAEWLPLLEDIDALRWRFRPPGVSGFVEIWTKGQGRPEFVELEISAAGMEAMTWVFYLPALRQLGNSGNRTAAQ